MDVGEEAHFILTSISVSEIPSEYYAAHVYNGDTGECLEKCGASEPDDPSASCNHKWEEGWICQDCGVRKEDAEELHQIMKTLTKAIYQPYAHDRLNAGMDYEGVPRTAIAILELLAKGIVGTATYEIEDAIRDSDEGIDNGHEIVHKMVYDEVFKIEKDWTTFIKEMSSLSDNVRENFTSEKARAIYTLSQINDSEYVILLDGDQDDWAKNSKLKSLWMLLGDEALENHTLMDEYRQNAKSLGTQSLSILSKAGKWFSKIGKGVNLMNL